MTKGRRGVNGRANAIGEGDGRLLARCVAARQAVDQGRTCCPQNVGRSIQGGIQRDGTILDLGDRGLPVALAEKPRLGQRAGVLRPHDALALHGDPQIITDATANGAGDVVNPLRHHKPHRVISSGIRAPACPASPLT